MWLIFSIRIETKRDQYYWIIFGITELSFENLFEINLQHSALIVYSEK
jgi:hypothetical protein